MESLGSFSLGAMNKLKARERAESKTGLWINDTDIAKISMLEKDNFRKYSVFTDTEMAYIDSRATVHMVSENSIKTFFS